MLVPPANPEAPAPLPSNAADLDFLPALDFDRPLWKSLLANFRDWASPEPLPPLELTSRPVDVGMLLGDRMSLPWFRTVFTNIGDVLSPEVLPPLELESRPVDVGELIGDQLSHLWFSSLLRNLADRFVPEHMPPLPLTSAPEDSVLSSEIMLLPRWSSVIDAPAVSLPDAPEPASPLPVPNQARAPETPLPQPVVAEIEFLRVMENDLKRDLSRSRFRARVWISIATAQVLFVLLSIFWPMLMELRH